MKKYTSEDIIQRALQLADLENSDFISDEEKIRLLNECYTILYQKVIDSGDKTWIKSVNVKDGDTLPEDLYQITAIYIEHSKEPIQKINSFQNPGYDIIGDKIKLSPCYNGMSIVMEYAPTFREIQLTEKTVETPYSKNVISACGGLYAWVDSDGYINVTDFASGKNVNTNELKENYTETTLYKNGVLLLAPDTTKWFSFYALDTTTLDLTNNHLVVIDNTLYIMALGSTEVTDIDAGDVVTDIADYNIPSVAAGNPGVFFVSYKDDKGLYFLYNGIIYRNELSPISVTLLNYKSTYAEEGLYLVAGNNQLILIDKELNIKTLHRDTKIIDIVSKKYCLGVTVFSDVQMLEGLRNNELLNYPNQLFWVMLAYMMAVQFKMKQGADVSQLNVEAQKAEMQFFDSISRDANEYYQMKNVYRTSRSGIYR
jgi:hypothetical protein